jgi:hypothetical protein
MPIFKRGKPKMMLKETGEPADSTQESILDDTANLENANTRLAVAERLSKAIEDHTAEIYDDGFRWHLGASVIGDECSRKLWYGFRWVAKENASGRMRRLWQRGHLEEPRHTKWLRGLGFTVWTHDESTGKQFRLERTCGGHFGGSLDGIARFPESWKINEPVLVSSKTSGTGAGFNKAKNEPLATGKPQHFIQESVYGRGYGIKYVIYLCVNKNDDDLAVKVEKLDFKLAENMEIKAEKIIFARTPPPRLSENANFYECKSLCRFKDVCHFKKPAEKNCRSCVRANAVDNGEFYCEQWNAIIPRDAVAAGCDNWQSITLGND